MLATATVHSDLRCAAAIYADTCSFTLTALSPSKSLWDAIPRDIDSIRHESAQAIEEYCVRLSSEAEEFSRELRTLLADKKLIVLDQIKQEVQGQRGRAHGLSLRAQQRFPHAPTNLVQESLAFQMAAHDTGLSAMAPVVERRIIDEIMRRLTVFWRELDARYGPSGVSVNDKLLFATAAANAIAIENGDAEYGSVILVSRDFNHVYRMYRAREELLRPVCRKLRLLLPRNFLFKPTFQAINSSVAPRPRLEAPLRCR